MTFLVPILPSFSVMDLVERSFGREAGQINLPPSYTVPPAPTSEEAMRTWTPEDLFEATRQRREQYLRDVTSPPVRDTPVSVTPCAWYQRLDAESGECRFGSGLFWVMVAGGVLLILMAAAVGAGAKAAGTVIEKRYIG